MIVALAVLLLGSPRLRVYYQGPQATVSVIAVAADGSRTSIDTPQEFRGVGFGIRNIEHRILTFAATADRRSRIPSGGRLEWSIRYAVDDGRDHRIRTVMTDGSDCR